MFLSKKLNVISKTNDITYYKYKSYILKMKFNIWSIFNKNTYTWNVFFEGNEIELMKFIDEVFG